MVLLSIFHLLAGFYSTQSGLPLPLNGRLPPAAAGLPAASRWLVGNWGRKLVGGECRDFSVGAGGKGGCFKCESAFWSFDLYLLFIAPPIGFIFMILCNCTPD